MQPVLAVRNVAKRFGGLRVLEDVSFDLYLGECLGLIGPNGAGKTTLFNIICGYLAPTAGQVLLDGRPIQGLRPSAIARLGIGRTFQVSRIFRGLTVLENVLVALGLPHYRSLAAALTRRPRPQDRERAEALLQQVRLAGYAGTRAGDLSLGLQRRLELARALALQPRVLMLDEPAAGLTHEEAEMLVQTVAPLPAQGLAVLLVEHNLRVTAALCQRIVCLAGGRKIAEGPPAVVQRHPAVVAAYLGEEEVTAHA